MYACANLTEAVEREWIAASGTEWEEGYVAAHCSDGSNKTQTECVPTPASALLKEIATVSDGETFSIMRGDKAVEVCTVEYTVAWAPNDTQNVSIDKATYKDYFKVGGKELAIPKA